MSIRRFTLVFVLVTVMVTGLFAQVPQSIIEDKSEGLFKVELDHASEAGLGFLELTNSQLFAGLANINKQDNDAGLTNYAPLWLGFFNAGEMPFSVFVGIEHTDSTGVPKSTVARTTTNKNVVSGTTTTDYEWVSNEVSTEYTRGSFFGDMDDQVLFLLGLSESMVVGANIVYDLTDNTVLANNFVETDVTYYDTAVATEAPNVQTAQTTTTTEVDIDSVSTLSLNVPFFLQTGDMGHGFNLGVSLNSTVNKASATVDVTEDASAAVFPYTITDTTNVANISGTATTISVGYSLEMPAFFGEHADNRFRAGASAGLTLHGWNAEINNSSTASTFTGAGTSTVTDRDNSSTVLTASGATDFSASASAGHSFYFDFGENVNFGINPLFFLIYTSANSSPYLLEQSVLTQRLDNDGDGVVDSAADAVNTTTTVYSNTGINLVTSAIESTETVNDLTFSFNLPVALKVKAGNLPVGFVLGSTANIGLTITSTDTGLSTSVETAVTADGTGTVSGTTVTNDALAAATTTDQSADYNWTNALSHNFGIWFDITDMVRLDIDLNLNDLLDWEDFTVQAAIKLP